MKEQFELQLPDLLFFVKASCHENLHDTLKVVKEIISDISDLHDNYPALPKQLPTFLMTFMERLQTHLVHEENTLFPLIASGKTLAPTLSIPHLVDDHEQMKADLLTIRKLTHNYKILENLDPRMSVFYAHLKEMDRIILNHIQIENHILFPMLLKTP